MVPTNLSHNVPAALMTPESLLTARSRPYLAVYMGSLGIPAALFLEQFSMESIYRFFRGVAEINLHLTWAANPPPFADQ
jgi:hypothetical protein